VDDVVTFDLIRSHTVDFSCGFLQSVTLRLFSALVKWC